MKRLIAFCALMLMAVGAMAQVTYTADVQFSCTPPTVREDGSTVAVADIGGYRVYEVTATGAMVTGVPVADKVTCDIKLVAVNGIKRYVMTAYDKFGLESDPSSSVTVSTSKLKAPGSVQVYVSFTVKK